MYIVQSDGSWIERGSVPLRMHIQGESEPLSEGAHPILQIGIEWMGGVNQDGV